MSQDNTAFTDFLGGTRWRETHGDDKTHLFMTMHLMELFGRIEFFISNIKNLLDAGDM